MTECRKSREAACAMLADTVVLGPRIVPRCASTIQIVRPCEATAEMQPTLQPTLLRLSPIISQYMSGR